MQLGCAQFGPVGDALDATDLSKMGFVTLSDSSNTVVDNSNWQEFSGKTVEAVDANYSFGFDNETDLEGVQCGVLNPTGDPLLITSENGSVVNKDSHNAVSAGGFATVFVHGGNVYLQGQTEAV